MSAMEVLLWTQVIVLALAILSAVTFGVVYYWQEIRLYVTLRYATYVRRKMTAQRRVGEGITQ